MMSLPSFSQDIAASSVPSTVMNTFKAKYPAANNVEWEKYSNYYEAELDLNDSTDVAVRIDNSGKLLMQKQEIAVGELPGNIMTAIQNQHSGYKVDDVDKLEKDGAVYYQVELERAFKRDVKRVFSANGQEIKGMAYWE